MYICNNDITCYTSKSTAMMRIPVGFNLSLSLRYCFFSQVAILHEPACRTSPSRATECAQPVAKETQPPSR